MTHLVSHGKVLALLTEGQRVLKWQQMIQTAQFIPSKHQKMHKKITRNKAQKKQFKSCNEKELKKHT